MEVVHCILFLSMDGEQVKHLFSIMEECAFEKDQFVFKEGDDGDAFYIITAGQLRITKQMPCGHEFIVAELGSGDIFGELSLVNEAKRSASCRFLEEGTVLRLSREAFMTLREESPSLYAEVVKNIGKLVCGRLSGMTAEVAGLLQEIEDIELDKANIETFLGRNKESLVSVIGKLGFGSGKNEKDLS